MPPSADAGPWTALPLFPLGTVLFPGGLLPLKVFEARYLDLISHCLRTRAPFAVVRIRQGAELRGNGQGKTLLDAVGVLAHLDWTLQPCHWPLPADLAETQRQAIEAALPPGRWVARADALAMGLPAPIRRWLEAGPPG